MGVRLILPLALAFLFLPYANGLLVNITVDDDLPDPVTGNTFLYAPDGKWNVGGQCPTCLAQPDVSSLLYGTWHDATWDPGATPQTAQIQFNGTAIYIFGMVSESGAKFTSTADIAFYVDGKLSGNFTYTPPGDNAFLYNISLFSKTGLDSGFHTFMMQNGGRSVPSLVLFDYMVYSQERPDPPASSTISSSSIPSTTSSGPTSSSPASTSAGADIGASKSNHHGRTIGLAVAIPCGVAILALIAWFLYRRNRNQRQLERRASFLVEDPAAAAAEPYPPNDNPAMRLAAVSATFKDHGRQPAQHSVSYLNETPPTQSSQSVADFAPRADTVTGSSELGSSWQDMPMVSGRHPDAPPAYNALSSTG